MTWLNRDPAGARNGLGKEDPQGSPRENMNRMGLSVHPQGPGSWPQAHPSGPREGANACNRTNLGTERTRAQSPPIRQRRACGRWALGYCPYAAVALQFLRPSHSNADANVAAQEAII